MLDNEQLCAGAAALVYCSPAMYVPQQVSYLSAAESQESPASKHAAMASLALEAHLDSSDSLPSVSRSSRRLREFIPEHKKDDDYWMKRQKNNEAAKRSREKRRVNDVVMSQRIMELTYENKRLRMELDAIRRAYGTPPPRLPQPLPPRPSVDMPCNADSYCIGGNRKQRRSSLPSPCDVAVAMSDAVTSLSCSSFACMPVELSRHMPPSLPDLQSFGGSLPVGGLARPLSFDGREGLIRRSPGGPIRSTCVLYPYECERLQGRPIEAVIPVGYGNEGAGTLSSANPTSHALASKVVFSPLDQLTSAPAGNQVNSSVPLLARYVNCLRTTTSESHLDTGMGQGNSISGQGFLQSQASRGRCDELPLLFSDVSSSDDDILGDLCHLRSLEERPLNLSTRSGSSPVRNGQALAISCRNSGFFSEYRGNPAVNSTTMPILEDLDQMTSAFNLPASFSRRNCNRNVLDSLSKVELQSPEVPRLSSSGFLLPSNDKVPEKKGLPEMLTREMISATSFVDSFMEGGSCLLKLSPQNMDATVRAICDEEETRSGGERVISDAELYALLQSDLAEGPKKAMKDAGQGLSRAVRGGVPLKLWHKWSSAFSEELKVMMEGREHDTDRSSDHFQE